MKMTPEMAQAMLDALKDGNAAVALELVEDMLLGVISGEDGESEPEDTSALAAPEGDEPPADDALGASEGNADDAEQMADDVEQMSVLSTLAEMTGTENPGEIVEQVRAWSASHAAAAERTAALEASSRRALVAELVTLGAETPRTAWEDEERKTPVARLRAEAVADMRARVAELKARQPAAPKPPRSVTMSVSGDGAGDVSTLSAHDLAVAKARGWTAQEYADRIARAVRVPS